MENSAVKIDKDALDIIKKLTQVSLQKKDCIEQYYLLTDGQRSALDEEDIDGFQSAFEEKQELASKIDKLDELYLKLFADLKQRLNINSLEEIKPPESSYFKRMKGAVETIIEVTESCVAVDNENIKRANDLLRKYTNEIKKSKNMKTVIKEYQKPEIKDNVKPVSKKF